MAAPRLSPDGTQVAFGVTGGGVYVCPLGGDAPCRGIEPDAGHPVRPAWHPRNGTLFARYLATAEEEVSTLYRADAALTEIEPVLQQTGIQDFPDISPDGKCLADSSWLTVMPYRGGVRVVQQLWTLDLRRGRAGQLLLSNVGDFIPAGPRTAAGSPSPPTAPAATRYGPSLLTVAIPPGHRRPRR